MVFAGSRARTVKRLCIAALLGITSLIQTRAMAQGRSARDYLNAPVDSWLTLANSNYSTSVTPEDGTDVSSRVRSNVFSQTVVLTRIMNFGGRTGGVSAIIPYAVVNARVGEVHLSTTGLADFGAMGQINIFGGPALKREQFRFFVPQTFSSFHFILLAPTGKYDYSNALNPSSNRWTFYPTVNYSWTSDKGLTWLELYMSTKLFTTNRNFGLSGMSSLAQNPLYFAELHASRNVIRRLWASGDVYYNIGGQTRIDGVHQGNAANTLRLGVGSGLSVWSGGAVIFNYEQIVAKPSGQPASRTFRIKIQQFW
ncbi:MAG TPA: transporter [Edaphobacter sp.]|nr:transporter [Edaphobacter sp.]